MTRPIRRPLAAAFVALLLLTGCQAGSGAQTSQPYNPGDGRNTNVPEDAAFDDDYMAVRNALVVSFGEDASLSLTLVNHASEGDVLQQAVVGETPVEIDGGPVEIAPDQRVRMGIGSDINTSIPGANLAPGDWTTLTLSFASAGTTTLDLLVVPPGDEYAIAPGDAAVSG
jgi:hypothetical protein